LSEIVRRVPGAIIKYIAELEDGLRRPSVDVDAFVTIPHT